MRRVKGEIRVEVSRGKAHTTTDYYFGSVCPSWAQVVLRGCFRVKHLPSVAVALGQRSASSVGAFA